MAFGKRKMIPHPLAKLIKVSKDFLRMNTRGESLVRDRLAYKNGIAQEKGFMTGTGVQQALGIFTASADGIPTTRDVSTGNTTTAPTFDGLLGAKYALKEQYRRSKSIRWIFHPDVLLAIAKLKDGNGQYLWKESVRVGEPDTILSIGLMESQYAPNTMTTGQYVGALGDWSYYWIADAMDFAIQRLDELYAATNQVGFICRSATDGQFTLAEAAVRVKLG
jgi:HK97 family phage major capsid protein